ncbi:MAG: hypothetical protein JSV03_05360 [Planctomycetota bacterium]|nr:MAG: hypothetical protein JSV03_05360 [Planctomycetota bacterium]
MTIPGRQGGGPLREVISRYIGIEQQLRLVHRRDRETSGTLLLAKTSDAQRDLSHLFCGRIVNKEYLAIVSGYTDGDDIFNDPNTFTVIKPVGETAIAKDFVLRAFRLVKT